MHKRIVLSLEIWDDCQDDIKSREITWDSNNQLALIKSGMYPADLLTFAQFIEILKPQYKSCTEKCKENHESSQ